TTFNPAEAAEKIEISRFEISVNGNVLEDAEIIINADSTVTFTVNATSAFYFSAGSNAVSVEYFGNDNEIGDKEAITVVVAKKVITAEVIGNADKIYDKNVAASGLVLILNGVEACDDGKVYASAESFTFDTADVGEGKTVTADNVILSGDMSSNYILSAEAVTTEAAIRAKEVSLEWTGVNGLVYSGKPANVTATATGIILGDEVIVTVENGDQVNVGTYVAEATLLSNPNYVLPAERTKSYTISPYKLYIPDQSFPYNGTSEFNIELDGVTLASGEIEKVKLKLTAVSADAGEYTYNSGANSYSAVIIGTENYEIADGGLLIIEKLLITDYDPPVAKELIYTGKSQVLILAGQAKGGTFVYSFAIDGVYSETLPEGTNAGEYMVWYYVRGDKNHLSTEPQWLKVEIKKAPPVVDPKPLANTLVYNSLEQELISRGSVQGGELLYSLDKNGPYTTDIPTGVNAGRYTVYYKVKGDSNHNDAEFYFVYVTIEKANPNFEIPSDLIGVKGKYLSDVDLPEGFDWENPRTRLVSMGEYDYDAIFTPEDTDNFNIVTVSVHVTVVEEPNDKPGDGTVVVSPDGFRCKMCAKYEANKNTPIVGPFYTLVHFFVHFAAKISHKGV
ncbi:MAG: hypothetical protein J1E34_09985, partial [Oscillospiraceae bacterium]|nr:hypothetical protein [Oscillospiraceae bacterium]